MSILNSGLAKSAAADAYEIDNSLRFNDNDSAYLGRTFSAGDTTSWTFSCWTKRGNDVANGVDGSQKIFGAMIDGSNVSDINFSTGDIMDISEYVGGSTVGRLQTTQLFRDFSAWYHIVVVWDSDNVSSGNRYRLYVNGDRVTAFSTETQPSSAQASATNAAGTHNIGKQNTDEYYDGYLAEMYFIDGQSLTADSFGELNSTTNQWIPKDAVDDLTFGTNGFYQKYGSTEDADVFADSSESFKNLFFDGTDDEVAPTTALQGGDSTNYAFSVAAWVKWDSLSGAIYSQYPDASSTGRWSMSMSGTKLYANIDGGAMDFYSTSDLSAGTWYFVVLTRTAATWKWYINGSLDNTTTSGGTNQIYNGSPMVGSQDYGASWLDGNIAQIATWNSALSAGDVTGLYNSGDKVTNWKTSYSSGMQLYWTMNNVSSGDTASTIYDFSGNSNNGTTAGSMVAPFSGHLITAVNDTANSRAQRKVGDSSIFFDGTGDYLTTTLGDTSDWAFGTENWTIEFWIRFSGGLGAEQRVINFADATSPPIGLMIETGTDNKMALYDYNLNSDWTKWCYDTNAYVLDTWYHYAIVRQGSDFRMYRDGVEQETGGTSSTSMASAHGPYIGTNRTLAAYATGYMDEIRISDTARYPDGTTFTTFGQGGGTMANPTPFTADANTKLLIHSDWTGGLGADSSGNYNSFTVTNLDANDQMIDTPTNNFATINPLTIFDSYTLAEGNLSLTGGNDCTATFGAKSGKWYWEMYSGNTTTLSHVGIICTNCAADSSMFYGGKSDIIMVRSDDGDYSNVGNGFGISAMAANSATLAGWTTGDVLQIKLDLDSPRIIITVDETEIVNITFTYTGENFIWPWYRNNAGRLNIHNFGQDSSFAGNLTAQGNQDDNGVGDFYYEPPTDFLALCTSNLSAELDITLPGDYFNTKLYTGDGNTTLAVTGVGFEPDFTWIKNRDQTDDHTLVDSVRGATNYLVSNDTDIEVDDSTFVASLDSDGFTVGDDVVVNTSTENYVSWNWKAGGAPTADNSAGVGATPTAGSVKIDGSNLGSALAGTIAAKRLSANTTSGFSIVQYVGTGSGATIAHGLSQAPDMVISKALERGTANWRVGGEALGLTSANYSMRLDLDDEENDNSNVFGAYPGPSVWTIGTDAGVNASTENYIAYCFHSVEGYSKVGSYKGNGDADGTFVYTGFRPAFFIIKNIDSAYSWVTFDDKRNTYNPEENYLYPSSSGVEDVTTSGMTDFVSNGFKFRGTGVAYNGSETFLYIAFAESPFKYSNAR